MFLLVPLVLTFGFLETLKGSESNILILQLLFTLKTVIWEVCLLSSDSDGNLSKMPQCQKRMKTCTRYGEFRLEPWGARCPRFRTGSRRFWSGKKYQDLAKCFILLRGRSSNVLKYSRSCTWANWVCTVKSYIEDSHVFDQQKRMKTCTRYQGNSLIKDFQNDFKNRKTSKF